MKMEVSKDLSCPHCGDNSFEFKREATYLYTYQLDPTDSESWANKNQALPYLFDNREQISEKEYLVCKNCGSCYPCSLDKVNNDIKLTILQKAVRSDYQDVPEYLG